MMTVPAVAPPTTGMAPVPPPAAPLTRYNPYMPHSPLNFARDPDDLAMKIALLISEQEAEFGVNMYQEVTGKDEAEVQQLVNRGFTVDEAILWIFERKGYRLKKHQLQLQQQQQQIPSPLPAQQEGSQHHPVQTTFLSPQPYYSYTQPSNSSAPRRSSTPDNFSASSLSKSIISEVRIKRFAYVRFIF